MAVQDWLFVLFWAFLAAGFGYLTWETQELRKHVAKEFDRIVPSEQSISLASPRLLFVPLESIFKRMLYIEGVAFLLTALAASIEAVFVFFK